MNSWTVVAREWRWLRRIVSACGIGLALAAGQARANEVVVYAAGDIAACRGQAPRFSGAHLTAERMAADMAGMPAIAAALGPAASAAAAVPGAVLTLGDNTYPVGKLVEFTDCYGPTWGRFKAITYPSPGNHEYAGGRAAGYFSYFGDRAGKGYYSFELGDWHLVSLNSSLDAASHQAQLDWLKADLAAHPAQCTLAYWHHPLFSSGFHGNSPRMREAWRLLQAAGAELVLSGHDHDYERFAPQDADGKASTTGLRQFVVGTGGAQLTPFLFAKPNSERRDNSRSGVLKLTLSKGVYAWEFLEASYDGYGLPPPPDKGSGVCH